MDTIVMVMVAAAWTAILGMLAWGVVTSWRRVMQAEGGTLPIFGMVERRGLALERVRERESFFGAVRRCAMCRDKERCRDWLAGRVGGPAPACPNEDFMDSAART